MTTTIVKKPFATRLDEEILKALSEAADNKNVSIAKYLEQLLINSLRTAGTLADDFAPKKNKNWGGDRSKKKKAEIQIEPLEKTRAGKTKRSLADEETTAGTGLKVETDVDAIELVD